jgi:hypothetical protein
MKEFRRRGTACRGMQSIFAGVKHAAAGPSRPSYADRGHEGIVFEVAALRCILVAFK